MTTPPLASLEAAHVLTVDEAAKLLRISRGLAFQAVRAGKLPHVRIGRRILIPRATLLHMVGLRSVQTTSPAADSHSAVPATDDCQSSSQPAEATVNARELLELAERLQRLVDSRDGSNSSTKPGT